ncbi:trimethyltridecatetraene synthase-like [Musa acuminata AAA Group]|uniref:trimethyltridecatetraene synthase-like n=1 Tax=Musa acuminata AAA Group TaxID=214697 RepID=UPI0031E308D7
MEIPSSAVYLAIVLVFTLLAALAGGRRRRHKLNLPPGPRPWPVIGNLNHIGPRPCRSLAALSQKYGPLMHLRFGSFPVVVGSSVDMAKFFLKTHDLSFVSRPKTASGMYTTYNYSDITWSPYGPYWRQARRICFMELFTPKRLDSYQYIRVEEVRCLLRDLFRSAETPVLLTDHLFTINHNIMSRMVLGRKYTLEQSLSSGAPAAFVSQEEFKEMIEEMMLLNSVINVGDLIPWLNFLDLQGYVKRMKMLGKRFDRFLEHVLDEHNERRRREREAFVPSNMVDVLLELADDPSLEVKLERHCLKAFILDMLVGGTDTSTMTIECAISEILKRPDTFYKATEELDRVIGRGRWVEEEDVHRLPYIEAIVKETMRMQPVAPLLVPRLSREHTTIDGYDIPAGTGVLVNVWAIGRDPAVWDAPEEFRPERFVGSSIDVKGHHFELLPFGAGRRMCPGNNLGLKVVHLSLANLLHGFKWRLPPGMTAEELSMDEMLGLTTPRKVRLQAVVEPKLPSHLYCA